MVEAVAEDCIEAFKNAPDEESVLKARRELRTMNELVGKLGAWAVDGERATDELERLKKL